LEENNMMSSTLKADLLEGAKDGLHKGWNGFLWMAKILVPVSFLTFLIEQTGLLGHAEGVLGPVMGFLHLPAVAAVPLVAGVLTGIYGGIAAMAALPMTEPQMTLVAIFLLISHNLIQEGAVQGKSGLHAVKAVLFRLTASVATVWTCGWFLDTSAAVDAGRGPIRPPAGEGSFGASLAAWGAGLAELVVMILAIILVLMVLLAWMKRFHITERAVHWLTPLLRLLGLERNVGVLWLTAVVFGITYGAAVIVQEAAESGVSGRDLERLHLSIGIQHSVFEDPMVFLPLGLSAFWLWVPRLVTAVAAVRLYDLAGRLGIHRSRAESAGIRS
jgi:hypothetical protein